MICSSAMKKVSDSLTETSYLVMPDDTNPLGFLRGGKLMDWIDLVAEITVQKHTGRVALTVAIDKVTFRRSVKAGDIVIVRASITRTFTSSLEVYVEVWAENPVADPHGEAISKKTKTNEAYLVFVTLGEDGKPCPTAPIQPVTDEEKKRYENALKRRNESKEISN